MDKKTLTIARVPVAVAAPFLAPVLTTRTDTSGGLATIEDVLRRADCFAVLDGGAVVAHYALTVNERAKGSDVVIVAAAGNMPGADLVASIIPFIEQQASGAKALTVHTKRRGMMAKLAKLGFVNDGCILRKALA